MAATIDSTIFDNGLDAGLKAIADSLDVDLHICSQQPTTYLGATSTYTLGNKVDVPITGPTAGDTSGRKVTCTAITGGSVTATDTATHIALVDTATSTVLVTQALSASQAVTNLNTFTLTAFDVEITDPV